MPSTSVSKIEQAIKAETPCLGKLKKEKGEEQTQAAVVKLLSNTVKFFSVGKNINSEQLVETARLIMQEYYFLKPEDLRLFFDRFKAGHYGHLFDRLDGSIILLALKQYADERMETAERMSNEIKNGLSELGKDGEKYYLKIGKKYIRETDDEYELTDKKEMAARYSWYAAMEIKSYFTKNGTSKVKIEFASPDYGLIDYIKKNKPELAIHFQKNTQTKSGREYTEAVKAIMQLELSDTEKENKIRALAGLLPKE